MEARGIVAVLGATGFIGGHVARALAAAGWVVRPIARSVSSEGVRLDVAHATPAELSSALSGCVAIVNSIGIKRPRPGQGFHEAHAGVMERIVAAARLAHVSRIIHISVASARADGPHAYHRTKAAAEQILLTSGLNATILRPSVVWGAGDDLVAHLSKMIRASPVFPIVGSGRVEMMPVHVEDVAATVVAALQRPTSIGRTYAVVGPERLMLRDIVARVSATMGKQTRIVPTPPALMVIPAAIITRFAKRPITTSAQLTMLREGLTGDGSGMRNELGVKPRPFQADGIRAALPRLDRTLLDLRLGEPRPGRVAWPKILIPLMIMLAAVVVGFRGTFADTWSRLVIGFTVAGLCSFFICRRLLVDAWRPTPWMILLGSTIGLGLYGASWVIAQLPGVDAAIQEVFALQAGHPSAVIAPTLLLAIVAEEVVWRGIVVGGLATRLPPWVAMVLGTLIYGGVHVASGSPLLVAAALGLGLLWGFLFLATRSLIAVIVSHAVWELLAAVVAPV